MLAPEIASEREDEGERDIKGRKETGIRVRLEG